MTKSFLQLAREIFNHPRSEPAEWLKYKRAAAKYDEWAAEEQTRVENYRAVEKMILNRLTE